MFSCIHPHIHRLCPWPPQPLHACHTPHPQPQTLAAGCSHIFVISWLGPAQLLEVKSTPWGLPGQPGPRSGLGHRLGGCCSVRCLSNVASAVCWPWAHTGSAPTMAPSVSQSATPHFFQSHNKLPRQARSQCPAPPPPDSGTRSFKAAEVWSTAESPVGSGPAGQGS